VHFEVVSLTQYAEQWLTNKTGIFGTHLLGLHKQYQKEMWDSADRSTFVNFTLLFGHILLTQALSIIQWPPTASSNRTGQVLFLLLVLRLWLPQAVSLGGSKKELLH
jgi:hypothetical protein